VAEDGKEAVGRRKAICSESSGGGDYSRVRADEREASGSFAPGNRHRRHQRHLRRRWRNLILGLGLDPVRVSRIAGHSNVSVTLNTYADEFDKAMHRDDLMSRIASAGFGSV
jgi:integrase